MVLNNVISPIQIRTGSALERGGLGQVAPADTTGGFWSTLMQTAANITSQQTQASIAQSQAQASTAQAQLAAQQAAAQKSNMTTPLIIAGVAAVGILLIMRRRGRR